MNIKGLVVGVAIVSVVVLSGCAAKADANQEAPPVTTSPPAATTPPATTLAPTGTKVAPPLLIIDTDCVKCHGLIPTGTNPHLTTDGD